MPYPYIVLFRIGPFSIFTFGIFMLIAFLLAIWFVLRRAKGKIEEDHIYNISIISLIAGIIGSRIAYILFNLQEFSSFYDYIAIWQGGMSFFGGFFLSLVGIWFYVKRKHLGFGEIADIFAPSLALGIAITRIGGFLAGANPGTATELPWAIAGTHPTALYHAAANFIIFFVLLRIEKSQLKEKFNAGYLFAAFLLFFSLERFVDDFFRDYTSQATILAARIVPLLLIAVAIFVFTKLRKKS